MTSEALDAAHPVTHFVAGLHCALDRVSGVPAWSMPGRDLADALVGLHREKARLVELELRLVAQADLDGVGSEVGAADTRAWWANTTRQNRRDVHRRMHLARSFTHRTLVHAALAAGDLAEDQACVIVRALEALPVDVEAAMVDQAEKDLVELAASFDAKALIVLGKTILSVVAPEVGEAQLKAALEREEREAAKACSFTMSDDGHGKAHGRFTLPTATAAMLRKHLHALAAPKHQASTGEDADGFSIRHAGIFASSSARLGQAFREYIERYPADRTPHAGGVSAQVTVTMTFSDFTGDTDAPAYLDTGELITAATARRLACEAGLVPVVLGGKSQPLDVGRTRRFHTPAQRIVIGLRDKTCTAEGCDCPPAMCHVHHDDPWSQLGHTSVDKGRLLCPRHHQMAHSPQYTMRATKNGRVIFART